MQKNYGMRNTKNTQRTERSISRVRLPYNRRGRLFTADWADYANTTVADYGNLAT